MSEKESVQVDSIATQFQNLIAEKEAATARNSQLHNFIKEILQLRGFPKNFAKFLRVPILKNICERLALRKVPF